MALRVLPHLCSNDSHCNSSRLLACPFSERQETLFSKELVTSKGIGNMVSQSRSAKCSAYPLNVRLEARSNQALGCTPASRASLLSVSNRYSTLGEDAVAFVVDHSEMTVALASMQVRPNLLSPRNLGRAPADGSASPIMLKRCARTLPSQALTERRSHMLLLSFPYVSPIELGSYVKRF